MVLPGTTSYGDIRVASTELEIVAGCIDCDQSHPMLTCCTFSFLMQSNNADTLEHMILCAIDIAQKYPMRFNILVHIVPTIFVQV